MVTAHTSRETRWQPPTQPPDPKIYIFFFVTPFRCSAFLRLVDQRINPTAHRTHVGRRCVTYMVYICITADEFYKSTIRLNRFFISTSFSKRLRIWHFGFEMWPRKRFRREPYARAEFSDSLILWWNSFSVAHANGQTHTHTRTRVHGKHTTRCENVANVRLPFQMLELITIWSGSAPCPHSFHLEYSSVQDRWSVSQQEESGANRCVEFVQTKQNVSRKKKCMCATSETWKLVTIITTGRR